MSNWISCEQRLPPPGVLVMTKTHGAAGEQNVQRLRRSGQIWFIHDESLYVYYTPTHWRPLHQNEELSNSR